MDYLDPRTEQRLRRKLFIGYGMVALAIGMASLILLYRSSGYSVDTAGEVTQSGLVFVSSQPERASLYVNGMLRPERTNARLVLPAATYDLRVSKAGYRDWQRQFSIDGGKVLRLDYPFLVPRQLTTATVDEYTVPPQLFTQSPDRRWLVVALPDKLGSFVQYDLKNPAQPTASTLRLPADSYTQRDAATHVWRAVEWAADSRSVLLEHTYETADPASSGREYVLLDRRAPETDSRNLTAQLGLTPSEQVSLFNKRTDSYYVYSPDTKVFRTVSRSGELSAQLPHVYGFKTYSDDTVLYVTDTLPGGRRSADKLGVVLQQGSRSTVLRYVPAAAKKYLLDIARYDGNWYVAVGADSEPGVHVYKNPQTQVLAKAGQLPSAWRFLRLAQAQQVAFSANARFLAAQNGQRTAVYDAETVEIYSYAFANPLDAPQTAAAWMDGHRLTYTSGGSHVVVEYDNQNVQRLQPSRADLPAVFSPDYHYTYALTADVNGKSRLSVTPLLVP